MPKGKHKGKHRVFTNREQLEEETRRQERDRQWRQTRGEDVSGSDSSAASSSEDDSHESGDERKAKATGPAAVVEVYNPNRQKTTSAAAASTAAKPADVKVYDESKLTRREREEIDKERARQRYQKLHAEGRTEEAQADLARLAIVRKQREEAAKKRQQAQKEKDAAKVAAKAR